MLLITSNLWIFLAIKIIEYNLCVEFAKFAHNVNKSIEKTLKSNDA